jgi:hypothetical protein
VQRLPASLRVSFLSGWSVCLVQRLSAGLGLHHAGVVFMHRRHLPFLTSHFPLFLPSFFLSFLFNSSAVPFFLFLLLAHCFLLPLFFISSLLF